MKETTVLTLVLFASIASTARIRRADIHSNLLDIIQQTPFVLKSGINNLNLDLLEQLDSPNGNVIYSPLSIHVALGMTVFGAPDTSPTFQQLAQALYGTTQYSKEYLVNYLKLISFYKNQFDVKIKLANRAFAAQSLNVKRNYTEFLTWFFQSPIQKLDFGNAERASNIINDFVNDATNGLIDEIVEPSSFSTDSRMVLINAIYFKANWKYLFKKKDTTAFSFTLQNGETIDYPHFMYQAGKLEYADLSSDVNARVLELPYSNSNFRMLLILPTDKIEDVKLQNLDMSNIPFTTEKVKIMLPRFKFDFEAELGPILQNLGVQDIFDSSKANLKDIADDNLYVSKVLHKAVVEVNEEGSEAAAATSVLIETRSGGISQDIQMIFNKPFYFVIQDKLHQVPLFMGKLSDPRGNEIAEVKNPQVIEASVEDSGCDELGYNTSTQEDGNKKTALPCKGQDTLPLRENFEK